MKYITLLIILLFSFSGVAQQAVVTTGGTASGANGSTEYSVGQTVFHTYQSAAGSVVEGIQNPYEIFIPIGIEELNGQEFRIYPNPSVDFIKIDKGTSAPEKLSWDIHDLMGKKMGTGNLSAKETSIRITAYSPGTYLLVIRDKDTKIREYKIIKE